MKNKKSLLSVLLAVVLLVLCVLGLLMTGANAGELDPNTTLYYINDNGNDDGETVKEGTVPVFETVRGALAYAKEQSWGANEKLRLEITQDALGITKSGNFMFSSAAIGTVVREDQSSLPITLTGRDGARVTISAAITAENFYSFCNNWYMDNIKFSITGGKVNFRMANNAEFHDCEFDFPADTSTLVSCGYNFADYALTEDNISQRLDENGEITVTVTYSGNTKAGSKCIFYGTNAYNSEKTSGPGTQWAESYTVGTTVLERHDFNGVVILKDSVQSLMPAGSAAIRPRNSTYLGDGIVKIYDQVEILGVIQNVFNRSLQDGSNSVVEIYGGTIGSCQMYKQNKDIGEGSECRLEIFGGTITGTIDTTKATAQAGDKGVIIHTATLKGNVTGNKVTLAGGTIYHGGRSTTITATSVAEGATVLVKQAQGVLHKDGVTALSVPVAFANQIQISNESADGFNPRGYLTTQEDATNFKVISNLPELESAVLVLDERVHVKVLIPKATIEHAKEYSGKKFAYYCKTLGIPEEAPIQLEWNEIPVYDEDTYVIELPAVSAEKFGEEFIFMCSVTDAAQESINTLATAGAAEYAESNPAAAAMFNALLDYGKSTVAGTTALDHFDADAVASLAIPAPAQPVKGEGAINFTNVTLLMGDTLGLRFKADGATTGATVKFNGNSLEADQYAIGENCVDLYVSAETLLNPLPVEIYDANGVLCGSFGYSVAGIANSIYTADNTNLKAAAILNLIAAIENYVA